jgi:hypothetical protein
MFAIAELGLSRPSESEIMMPPLPRAAFGIAVGILRRPSPSAISIGNRGLAPTTRGSPRSAAWPRRRFPLESHANEAEPATCLARRGAAAPLGRTPLAQSLPCAKSESSRTRGKLGIDRDAWTAACGASCREGYGAARGSTPAAAATPNSACRTGERGLIANDRSGTGLGTSRTGAADATLAVGCAPPSAPPAPSASPAWVVGGGTVGCTRAAS